MLVKAEGVSLEALTLRASQGSCVTSSGAKSRVHLFQCTLAQADRSAVIVHAGATAVVTACTVGNSAQGCGALVRDAGSLLQVRGCSRTVPTQI